MSKIENTLVYSSKGIVPAKANESADALLSRVVSKTTDIADLVAVVGAVVGHVRTFVDCPAGKAAISVDITSSPEIIKSSQWLGDKCVDECELTIDILSFVNTDAPVEAILRDFIV